MGLEKIPVFKPLIEAEEFEASRKALELGWLGMGSYVGEFEEQIKQFLARRIVTSQRSAPDMPRFISDCSRWALDQATR